MQKSISTEIYDCLTHLELQDPAYLQPGFQETDDVTSPINYENFDNVRKERDDLKLRCRQLSSDLAHTKSLLAKKTYPEVKVGVSERKSRSRSGSVDDLDSGKDIAVRHLEEQLGFLVEEMTSMIRQSKEKDQEVAKLQETLKKRDEKVKQLRWQKRKVEVEIADLRETCKQVTLERNKLQEERETMMSTLQNCVELGRDMEELLSNVNGLTKLLWDNFAKLETIDVQLLASEKQWSYIQKMVKAISQETKGKLEFGDILDRHNQTLDKCLVDRMQKIKEMEEVLMKLESKEI
jgi:chromosome segregation ATPase